MIPLSVRMTGWMRYRDETVADFTAGALIAICGENGAGKSSIFDAITFALYGETRIGKQDIKDLISEDRDRLSVDFEFEQQGMRYLIRRGRTSKASGSDQSIYFWDEEKQDYVQVPGTEKKDSLQRVIENIVRLSEEAFTSSFILQQGAATQFIDAKPKERFQVISSLIGLKEYERLEKAARDAFGDEKKRVDWIGEKLAEIGDVDEAAIAAMRDTVATTARREADATLLQQAAREMLADAQRYTRLVGEIAGLDAKIAAATELIAQREQIERDAALFETLSSALDRVTQVQHALADATRAEAAAADAQRKVAAIDIEALAAANATATAAVKAAAKQLQSAEKSHAAAQQAERQAHDFAQLAASVRQERDRLASFDERIKEIDAQLKQFSSMREKVDRDAVAAKKAAEESEAALEAARKDGAGWRARAEQLKHDLAERKAAAKEAKCSRCGQPIDKAAAKKQIDGLTAQLGEAQSQATASTAGENAAAKARTAAAKAAEQAAAAVAQQAQQHSRLEGERTAAETSRAQAATALAEHEARLNGRMKDVATAQKSHASAKSKLDDAAALLDAARATHESARKDEDTARTALDTGKHGRAELDAAAREQAATAAGHRKLAETTAAGLGDLREQALGDPAALLEVLRRNQSELAGAPGRKEALESAQQAYTAASAQREAKQHEADQIPAAHQVDEALAHEAASEAEATAATARADHLAAQQRFATAEAHVAELARFREEVEMRKQRHQRLRRLTTLLGKKGLQGVLVSGALTTITNHANAFLKRLTGGSLELTLERDGDALELRAIDHTCMREARSAKALSGSQKFRCAVAIASGIGQYAGAGGMRSIVIDEGFGSLDVEGQKLMVAELQQLAQYMDKVIVVSHLEAFSDPVNFPDRLQVQPTTDGASTIKRAG
ncbi:MAG: SMC family ATPase [Chloroflexi bacterium]|nr:SMC family ATPase [Chloroflexota bacterium]